MNMMHVSDSIPAYTLDILEDSEQAAVRQHLSACAVCREELRAYQQIVTQLAEAVPQRTPPSYLRAAILQRAAAADSQSKLASRPAWLTWIARPFSPAAGWLAIAIIVVLVGMNLYLWQQSQHPAAPVLAPTLAAGEFVTVHMLPPQSGNATGLLVISGDGDFGTLVVDGLELLDKTQQYQLWLIKDGKRTSGGVFSVGENGYGIMAITSPLPLIQYQSFGITVEPFGGSPGPTGKKVLGGSL